MAVLDDHFAESPHFGVDAENFHFRAGRHISSLVLQLYHTRIILEFDLLALANVAWFATLIFVEPAQPAVIVIGYISLVIEMQAVK